MILVGHSFGGYIAGNYAVRYEKYLSKLILLSPCGFAKST
jgi:alpha-beta hydrolase superfamily lysophospholipase